MAHQPKPEDVPQPVHAPRHNYLLLSAMGGLSLGEKKFIKGGIAQDLRTDRRKRLIYRPIYVETGVIPQASGSARVKMGATDVIASVKGELGKPNPSHPDKGKVSIFDDCSSTADPTFEGRGGEELASELSSALQRCLLGGKSGAGAGIDFSSLSIVEVKVCWDLYIDGLVVSSDGSLLDALGAAIKAALSNTAIPKVQVAANASSDDQPEVDVSDEEFLQFDTSGVPVIITLTKVGRHYIVDATTEEESQMSSAVSVSINRQGRICGLTKRGGAGLDPSIILDMISVAKHASEQLINKLDSEIAAAEEDLFSLPKQGFDISLTQQQLLEEHDHQHPMEESLRAHIEFLETLNVAGVSQHSLLFSKTAPVQGIEVKEEVGRLRAHRFSENAFGCSSREHNVDGADYAFNPKGCKEVPEEFSCC